MFKYYSLDNFDFANKVVAVRLDLNSPIMDGKLVKTKHITRSMKTVRELLRKGAKVVLLSHQGRYKTETCISLKGHIDLIKTEVTSDINFIEEFDIDKIKKNISNDKYKLHLLENLRLCEDEINYNKMDNFILSLQDLFDYYVIEVFFFIT